MSAPLAIGPIVLPVLFWAWYHYHKDRHLPEPAPHLAIAFLLGGVAYWLGMLMYAGLGRLDLRYDAYLLADTDRVLLFLYAVLAIGPIEELAKLIPFLLVILRFPAFNEPIDGIIYASFIALGFAAVENWFYLPLVTSAEALARGFAGPVVHIVFASIWGYYVGGAFLARRRLFPAVLSAVALTASLHGLYDYLVIAMPAFALPTSALLVLGIWIWRMFLIRELQAAARESA